MKIRLCIDEDAMTHRLTQELRMRGVDVTTARDEGLIQRSDDEHLEYATGQGRVLYSFNVRDYQQLHTEYLMQGREHAGIVLAHQRRYGVGEQIRRLSRLIAVRSAEEMRNNLEFLSSWG